MLRILAPAGRAVLAVSIFLLAGCAETKFAVDRTKVVTAPGRTGALYKIGQPYQIKGVWYYPAVDYEYDETGIASWYGPDFHGQSTANGETYSMNDLTAAHQTLPMPSFVRVTNLENGRVLAVRVNDRGPFVNGRIIDVSRRAAQLLGFERSGTARVRVEIMAEESRALASRALAQGSVAGLAEEPTPQAAPSVAVTAQALPPPGGGAATPPPPDGGTGALAPSALGQANTVQTAVPDGRVTYLPVRATSIYIQAGAFSEITNANRLVARLSQLGPTRMTPVQVQGQRFYRVRLGPIASVEEADRLLARVVQSGHPEARVVVD